MPSLKMNNPISPIPAPVQSAWADKGRIDASRRFKTAIPRPGGGVDVRPIDGFKTVRIRKVEIG